MTMNSQANLEFCMTQISRNYNRHSRRRRCMGGMADEEPVLCSLER